MKKTAWQSFGKGTHSERKMQVYKAIKNKDKLMEQWMGFKNSGKANEWYRWDLNKLNEICTDGSSVLDWKICPSLDLFYKQRPLN